MNRTRLLIASMLVCVSNVALEAAESRPNVILIMVDDFGFECVTANGGESYQTPILDRMASEGMRFTQCHVQPLCTPTRVQLMTGLYNVRNYLQFGVLPRSETTFGNLFRDAGYATAICGKWQLGHDADLPAHFGFDESYLWQHTRRPPRYANPGLEHNAKQIDFGSGEYGPQLVNDFAVDFITRNHERPFLLYYPMILTHDPFQPTPDSPNWDPKAGVSDQKDVKHFADMTKFADKMVGRVLSTLDDLKIRDNTLVLVIGDNGTHKTITSRFRGADYQGAKGSTTAGGTHVPMIASWPGTLESGRVCDDLISSADFLPTICEAAGIQVSIPTDGVSFLPQLRGESGNPRSWLYCWYSPRQQLNLSVQEFAFDHRHKLYADGTLYRIDTDRMETSPIDPQSSPDAIAATAKLRGVLDLFANARPARLDSEFKASRGDEANSPRRQRRADGNPARRGQTSAVPVDR